MHSVKSTAALGAALMASVLTLGGCAESDSAPVMLSGPTMGTQYHVSVARLPEGIPRAQLQREIDARLETVNDQMSTYRPDSELSRFNQFEGADWFAVSADTAFVVEAALRTSAATGGAFDATVEPLVNLWSFGPDPRERQVPADEELAAALKRVGYEDVEVRMSPPALRKARPDIHLDLSAIAKGFGVDKVAEYLEDVGISGYLVEIGGEMRAAGTKADGTPWRIGIESPVAGRRSIQRIIPLRDVSLATSGDYRNYFEENGRRFSHTIDPRTGRPIEHQLASVSVIADNCMSADAWATALMVLGPKEGYNWAQERGLAVLLIIRDEGGFVEKPTPAFVQRFP